MPTYEWHELSPSARFFFVRVLPLLLLFIGLVTAFYVYETFRDASDSHGWPTVPGVVTHSEVEHEATADGDGTLSLDIRFEYIVDGKTYKDSGPFFGTFWRSSDKYEASRRYPAGEPVTVYYKPSDPETAVLEPGIRGVWVFRGIGLLALIFVIGGLVFLVVLPGHARKAIARHERGEGACGDLVL